MAYSNVIVIAIFWDLNTETYPWPPRTSKMERFETKGYS